MKKVCIITTVHKPFDIRIFYKEAITLSNGGFDVELIATSPQSGVHDGIHLTGIPAPPTRFHRIWTNSFRAFRLALKSEADIYHFHDPELLFVGVMLKLCTRKRVIYDCHEHFAESILYKSWIPSHIRIPYSIFCKYYEQLCYPFLDAVVGVVDEQGLKFKQTKHYVTLHNYPLSTYFSDHIDQTKTKLFDLVYVGGLSMERGLDNMLAIVLLLKTRYKLDAIKLCLIGRFVDKKTEKFFYTFISENNLQDNIEYSGYKDVKDVYDTLRTCRIGLWLGKKTKQYSAPQLATKVFEYMGAQLPVLSTDYDYLKNHLQNPPYIYFIGENSIEEAVEVIHDLLSQENVLENLGLLAYQDFTNMYNWEQESAKLINLYNTLLTTR